MQYNDLLGKAWSNLGSEDREKALKLAYTAGREAAELGVTAKGGSDLIAYRRDSDYVDFFFHYLIEDMDFFDDMEDSDRYYWIKKVKRNPTVDPRVPAFCLGWRRFMDQEILETLDWRWLLRQMEERHGQRTKQRTKQRPQQ